MSSVAARFFTPQIAGIGATPAAGDSTVFRIDHDERFNQTTHLQYQFWKGRSVGRVSTGAMTPALWPVRCRAPAAIALTARTARIPL